MKRSTLESKHLMRRAEDLIAAASNRYRITVQVANRAQRRRYEDFDAVDDHKMKPVIRAVIEMSDELTQYIWFQTCGREHCRIAFSLKGGIVSNCNRCILNINRGGIKTNSHAQTHIKWNGIRRSKGCSISKYIKRICLNGSQSIRNGLS